MDVTPSKKIYIVICESFLFQNFSKVLERLQGSCLHGNVFII